MKSSPLESGNLDSRTKILAAFAALLIEEGAQEISIRKVAKRALVNHGLVHHYFGSKEGMLVAGMRYMADQKIRGILQAVVLMPEGQLGEGMCRLLVEDPDFPKFLLEMASLSRQSPGMAESLKEVATSRAALLQVAFGLTRDQAIYFQATIAGLQFLKSLAGPSFIEPGAREMMRRFVEVAEFSKERLEKALLMVETLAAGSSPGKEAADFTKPHP
ncbi:MAG: hypothetical protein A2600_05240 [Candidatus Lambdaproteobacteria bacterium RIFOXYD1_FULL_56_27]|uniref:HTH tetR-type domain-containing protein n=1 Tax=Candidatus Lambdaproteobacteria bacterium RIFOXYD2_FULL_56_26 TaxID=1817773 RepID=A0A1F6GRU9_9PROT|nr:MAG: hypothetical protein A2426_08095 [Candidatus Lambdaproteobacteria bacterium RIFOXYC1_FULL_56_13]OGH00778.1 MAG: hypothetical protein A2557_03645 [Candidatus Lambdaproteobacteria bacterium RIFOXYD2_FULL_56_26]OGH09957.1 MAG: hypothetical protein A2600_05240 [Candidatus Lambdaproteobacteria bacterium RIFOXYD1_FULL_56_27]